jgi:HAD superfamily phosphoserine phosphatase-like hydrolase
MADAFCFDLDGTITSREILPMLAAEVGYAEELAALTDATIKGVIPFASSFRLRCKILSDLPISQARRIIEATPLFPRIADFVRSRPNQCFVVTGNLDIWIEPLVLMLGVKAYSSTAETESDRLVRVRHVLDKGDALKELRPRYDRIIAVGDGMGDVSMFENADVKIAFGGVHRPVDALVDMSDMICLSETALLNTLERML